MDIMEKGIGNYTYQGMKKKNGRIANYNDIDFLLTRIYNNNRGK